MFERPRATEHRRGKAGGVHRMVECGERPQNWHHLRGGEDVDEDRDDHHHEYREPADAVSSCLGKEGEYPPKEYAGSDKVDLAEHAYIEWQGSLQPARCAIASGPLRPSSPHHEDLLGGISEHRQHYRRLEWPAGIYGQSLARSGKLADEAGSFQAAPYHQDGADDQQTRSDLARRDGSGRLRTSRRTKPYI